MNLGEMILNVIVGLIAVGIVGTFIIGLISIAIDFVVAGLIIVAIVAIAVVLYFYWLQTLIGIFILFLLVFFIKWLSRKEVAVTIELEQE